MKLINFVNPCVNEENKRAYSRLVHCSFAGFAYDQTNGLMRDIGYHVSEELYYTFARMQDINAGIDMDPKCPHSTHME